MHAIKHEIANQIPSHGWPDEKPVVAYRKEIILVRSLLVIIKNYKLVDWHTLDTNIRYK